MYDDNRRRWNSTATRACANSGYQALSLLLNRPGYEAMSLGILFLITTLMKKKMELHVSAWPFVFGCVAKDCYLRLGSHTNLKDMVYI